MFLIAPLPPAVLWIQECVSRRWSWQRIGVIPYFLFLLIVVGLPLWLLIRFQRRLHRRVVESGYLVCTDCGYSLRGLPTDEGFLTCPECGRPRSVEGTRNLWLRWSSESAWLLRHPRAK